MSAQYIDEMKATLETQGFVVIKVKSYRAARERQCVAECMREMAEKDAEAATEWARNCLNEERRLRDRLTFVYGVAQSFGATPEDLRGMP